MTAPGAIPAGGRRWHPVRVDLAGLAATARRMGRDYGLTPDEAESAAWSLMAWWLAEGEPDEVMEEVA